MAAGAKVGPSRRSSQGKCRHVWVSVCVHRWGLGRGESRFSFPKPKGTREKDWEADRAEKYA